MILMIECIQGNFTYSVHASIRCWLKGTELLSERTGSPSSSPFFFFACVPGVGTQEPSATQVAYTQVISPVLQLLVLSSNSLFLILSVKSGFTYGYLLFVIKFEILFILKLKHDSSF